MTDRFQLNALGRLGLFGEGVATMQRRRKELALLVVLADRSPRWIRREELQALFWGERDETRARNSFRQALLQLRRALDGGVETDGDLVRLAPGSVTYDVRLFEELIASGDHRRAIDLWAGPFLSGCDDVGGEEFRLWLDVERERLRQLLHASLSREVERAARDGDERTMLEIATRATVELPLDRDAHRWLIDALARSGQREAALAARSAFIRRSREELGESPDAEWLDATDQIIGSAVVRSDDERLPVSEHRHTVAAQAQTTSPVRAWTTVRWVAAALLLLVTTLVGTRLATARPGRPPALAVGEITSSLPRDSIRGFATLLTINLGRIEDLDVISERRLSELAASGATRGAKVEQLARVAGARELLDGVLSPRPNGGVRADFRRIDLASGKTRGAYAIESTDLVGLADLLTEHLARDLGVRAPASRREASTTSLVAYRLYEQGLRAYYELDAPAARRFFAGALSEDSTFALAALYAGLSSPDSLEYYTYLAHRHAERAVDRERLLINATWGRIHLDPRALSWADTLVRRYPSEPDAYLIYAEQLRRGNAQAAAIPHLRRVIAMDSMNARTGVNCRACTASKHLAEIYSSLDSFTVADSFARAWIQWHPRSGAAWREYSKVLGGSRRYDEAHTAIDSAIKYANDPALPFEHTVWWFRTNDFANIDRLWAELQRSAKPDVRMDALWTRVIASRTQGRMRDALAAAREFRRYSIQLNRGGNPNLGAALPEAIVLFETGQLANAAALYDSIARFFSPTSPSVASAHRAWIGAHTASVYAAARDTMSLRRFEDTVRVYGIGAATDRHAVLHHYVRGLRLAVARRPLDAAGAFRRAMWGRDGGYVRVPLELGRALIDAGKADEAITPLRAALDGPTSAYGLYATRTEIQELLGLAYERSQQPDSAIALYNRAAQAWSAGDPEFQSRRAQLQTRVSSLLSLSRPRRG